jgi:hypothetical protein
LIYPSGTIPATANLRIRFNQFAVNDIGFRIDDVVLQGTPICNSTSEWNGIAWSNGSPSTYVNAVISGNYDSSVNGDVTACTLVVNSPSVVTVKAGNFFKISNNLTVATGATLTFEDKASLIQVSDAAVNSGNITYKRTTTAISNFDYTYWSTPVKNQTLYDVSPNTLGDKFYSFSVTANDWQSENYSNIMEVGKGYIIRGPQDYMAPAPKATYSASFYGEPYTGSLTTAVGAEGYATLIGNPYPSALDATSFIDQNAGVIDGTLYFWTHATEIGTSVSNPGTGVYAYSADDYATYNNTGAVAVNGVTPTGKIASGQSFFTTSIAAGNIIFNNGMRVGVGTNTGDNSQFFKSVANTTKTTDSEKSRLWLNLMNEDGVQKQLLIGYVVGATNAYDNGFDGQTFDGNAYIDFYSVLEDTNLVIQGRIAPFDVNDAVPLGYSTTATGTFTITVDTTDGDLMDQDIFLTDKLTNSVQNLKEGAYTFFSEAGTFKERFVLTYINAVDTIPTTDLEFEEDTIIAYQNEADITVKATVTPIAAISVYDSSGKLIKSMKNLDAQEEVVFSKIMLHASIIFLKIELADGYISTKKMVNLGYQN